MDEKTINTIRIILIIIIICGSVIGTIAVIAKVIDSGQAADLERLNRQLGNTNKSLEERLTNSTNELNFIESEFRKYRVQVERTYTRIRESITSSLERVESIEDIIEAIRGIIEEIESAVDDLDYFYSNN